MSKYNEYIAVNEIETYKKLVIIANELVDVLWGLEKHGYDTHSARYKMESIKRKLDLMDRIMMPQLLYKTKPWEKYGISATQWRNDQRKLYNGEMTPILQRRYKDGW